MHCITKINGAAPFSKRLYLRNYLRLWLADCGLTQPSSIFIPCRTVQEAQKASTNLYGRGREGGVVDDGVGVELLERVYRLQQRQLLVLPRRPQHLQLLLLARRRRWRARDVTEIDARQVVAEAEEGSGLLVLVTVQ